MGSMYHGFHDPTQPTCLSRLLLLLVQLLLHSVSASPSPPGAIGNARQPTALLQAPECASWTSSSGLKYQMCVIHTSLVLLPGKPATLPDRTVMRGQAALEHGDGDEVDTTCGLNIGDGDDDGWGCDDMAQAQYLAVRSMPVGPYPSGSDSTLDPNVNGDEVAHTGAQSVTAPTLDLASLSLVFEVPPNGLVVIRDLRITGARLPNTTRTLPAASFLALSAFRLAGDAGAVHTPLQLSNLVISTPSCTSLAMHQSFACALSPSPNFTITPSSLVVHRFTTPTASITNVTLECSGAPVQLPCMANKVSSGSQLMDTIRTMRDQAEILLAQLNRIAMPCFLYLQQDITLVGPGASPDPITLSAMQLSIGGPPDGTTVLDLANTASLISITRTARVQLMSMTIRNPPLGPPSAIQFGLLRLFIWTFSFSRKVLGARLEYLQLHTITVELPGEELAMWFVDSVGRDSTPAELLADLCVDEGSALMEGFTAEVVETTSGRPSLLIIHSTTWSDQMVMDNVLVTKEDTARGCHCGSDDMFASSDDIGAGVTNSTASSRDEKSSPPGAPPVAISPPIGDTTPCRAGCAVLPLPRPLCRLVPEGMNGKIVGLNTVRILEFLNPTFPSQLTMQLEMISPIVWMVVGSFTEIKIRLGLNMSAASLVAPGTLVGSSFQVTVMDVGQLPSAVVLASDNASVTVRDIILTGLPPAGLYIIPNTNPPNPSARPALAPQVFVETSPGVPLTSRRLTARTTTTSAIHDSDINSTAVADSSTGSRRQGKGAGPRGGSHLTVGKTSELAAREGSDMPTRRPRRRLHELVDTRPTQGLSPALTNFTSCLWTMEFDRPAAAAGAAAALNSTGGGTSTIPRPVLDSNRPTGLPYVFLDSAILVIPQAELELLMWAWGASFTATGLDSGLADQLGMMLAGSVLSPGSAVAAAQSALVLTTSLSFERLWWCGLQGRNVTFTSQLPVIPGLEPPLQLPQRLGLPVCLPSLLAPQEMLSPPPLPPPTPPSQKNPTRQEIRPPAPTTLGAAQAFSQEARASPGGAPRGGVRAIIAGCVIGGVLVISILAVITVIWIKVCSRHLAVSLGPKDKNSDVSLHDHCPAVDQTERHKPNCSGMATCIWVVNEGIESNEKPEAVRVMLMSNHSPASSNRRSNPSVPSDSSAPSITFSAPTSAAISNATPPSPGPEVDTTVQRALTMMYTGIHQRHMRVSAGRHVLTGGNVGVSGGAAGGLTHHSSSSAVEGQELEEAMSHSQDVKGAEGAEPGDSAAGPQEGAVDPPEFLTICSELGRGAQGVVHRGVWRGLDVAVKSQLLQRPAEGSSGPQDSCAFHDASRAIQEAAISSSVSHPNVVATYTYMLQRLGEDVLLPSTARGVTSNVTADGRAGGGSSVACSSGRGGSDTFDGAELEVWKLTLVQELCDANSLRHCLERGTLVACRVSQAGSPPGTTCWRPIPDGPQQITDGPQQPSSESSLVPAPLDVAATSSTSFPQQTQLQLRVVLTLALQAARGLAHLHRGAIVHADISSSNILLKSVQGCTAGTRGDGVGLYKYGYVAKVCDFGLSGRLGGGEQATHISGPARRSSAYSAPELVRHGRAGPAGDVYAFAVVLWELALGAPLQALLSRPEGARVQEWLAQQARSDPYEAAALPPDLLVWPANVPHGFIALAGQCLLADPSSRPSSQRVCCLLECMLLGGK